MISLKTRSLKSMLDAMYLTRAHRFFEPMCSGVGAIFTLHRVRPSSGEAFAPNRILEVTPEFLEATIRQVLARGREIVTLDEACRRLKESDFRNKFVCFTFDDGYLDNMQYALPVFQKYDAPFAIYVPTAMPEGTAMLWWEVLEQIIRKQSRIEIELDGEPLQMSTFGAREKYQCFETLYWPLRQMDTASRNQFVRALADRYEVDPATITRQAAMTWPMLRELAATGLVSIESHTVNHSPVSALSADEMRREAVESRETIGREIGRESRHFAYPFGDALSAGRREFQIMADLGFETATTTRKGVLFPEHSEHLHALPRVSLNGDYQARRYVDLFLSGAPFALWHRFQRLDVS